MGGTVHLHLEHSVVSPLVKVLLLENLPSNREGVNLLLNRHGVNGIHSGNYSNFTIKTRVECSKSDWKHFYS